MMGITTGELSCLNYLSKKPGLKDRSFFRPTLKLKIKGKTLKIKGKTSGTYIAMTKRSFESACSLPMKP